MKTKQASATKSFQSSPTNLRNKFFLSLLVAGTVSGGKAAIIAQQLGGAIDPAGNSEVDSPATGSTLQSTFNGLSGKVIQANWNGIGGSTGNTIDGGDVDVRIDHTAGGFAASTSTLQNFNTSTVGNGYQWSGSDGNQVTISFGTLAGSFGNDRTVQSAGLVLTNFGGAYTNVTINYLDSSNGVLSTQSFAGTPDSQGGGFGGADFFTGYVSASQNIASLTVDITRNTGNSDIGLDALSYVVPEVSSAALLGFGMLGLLRRRRSGAA